MTAKTAIPARTATSTVAEHVADHAALHADYNKFAVPVTKGINYTLVSGTDGIVIFNGASLTATLPTPVGAGGEQFIVKNINASALTVGTTAGTIDGAATQSLAQYTAITVVSDNADWHII